MTDIVKSSFVGNASPQIPLVQPRPTAYAAPSQLAHTLDSDELHQLCQLAAEILQDPLAVQRLSDRVMTLMQHDLQLQRERNHGYGRRW